MEIMSLVFDLVIISMLAISIYNEFKKDDK
jgi:hypothetical protein